jgi:hypothetical protein
LANQAKDEVLSVPAKNLHQHACILFYKKQELCKPLLSVGAPGKAPTFRGASAARFAFKHPDKVKGLVLWASYPPGSVDLFNSNIAAASISGSLDGLSTPEKIQNSRKLMPAATRWVAIEGGNHAQFGWYGPQNGDRPATLSHAEQQSQIISATLELLKSLEGQKGKP